MVMITSFHFNLCSVHLAQVSPDVFTQMLMGEVKGVAEWLGVRQSVVWRLGRRYQITGNVTRHHGQGRHRTTTALDDRFLRLQALRERTNTVRALQNELLRARGRQISDQSLDRCVRRRQNPPATLQELEDAFLGAWKQISQENIRRLIRSMPRRCETLIEAEVKIRSCTEVLQALDNRGQKIMHALCQKIWKTGLWPEDWPTSILLPLHKKGPTTDSPHISLWQDHALHSPSETASLPNTSNSSRTSRIC
ncbi:hypothetical protein ILUMI_11923 [Ignelater luminosus]|uniref:Uncharacterized protein n=1 Tax=Ignelater luminosus TaxID=2038154 RepID=A0A8K0D408_IGNLU|nr:hypothetical protein ILUMI_11923 [Ignelater luminosus]